MKIDVIKNKSKVKGDYYKVVVHTMEGDADDYHKVVLDFDNNVKGIKLLRECIIACEVISKHYPNGMGGGYNFYGECPYWMKWFDEGDWFSDCDSGTPDSFDGYEVYYFDADGKENKCKITLDKEMEEEISKANILRE